PFRHQAGCRPVVAPEGHPPSAADRRPDRQSALALNPPQCYLSRPFRADSAASPPDAPSGWNLMISPNQCRRFALMTCLLALLAGCADQQEEAEVQLPDWLSETESATTAESSGATDEPSATPV